VVGKETIVVPVSFQKDEKALQTALQKRIKAKQPGPTVTVEGKGSIMTDGTLVISDAIIIPRTPFEER
jgi:hypothetical protein